MKKIKEILLMENKIFEIIHITSIILIFLVAILIAIESNMLNKIKAEKENNLLQKIEIIEDTETNTVKSNTQSNEEVLINPRKRYCILWN